MTPIAAMVEKMIEAGVAPNIIALAISTAEFYASRPPDNQVDKAAERRRAWDREYRRKQRENPPESTRNPPDPPDGLSLIEKKEERKRTTKRETKRPIPPDWKPNDRHAELCVELAVPIDQAESIFRENTRAKGVLYVDHDAAFCTYIRNFHKFNGHNGAANGHGNRAAGANQSAGSTGQDATLAGMGRIAARVRERRAATGSGNRALPFDADITGENDAFADGAEGDFSPR